MPLNLDSADITLTPDNQSPLSFDLNNATEQSPGLVKWAAGNIRAELRYREASVTGPYTAGNYNYAVVTQLHSHTTASDGHKTPAQLVATYAASGFDALGISDHDLVTSQPSGITVALPANECTFNNHILSIGCAYTRGGETNPQNVINGIKAAGGLAVIAHPRWGGAPTSVAQMLGLTGWSGLEIYNAITIGHGQPQVWLGYAVAEWDQVLAAGRRNTWGFAHDDYHWSNSHAGWDKGRIIVFCEEETPAAVLAAIERGDFVADVANFGVTLNPPTVTLDDITIDCPGAVLVRFITEAGLVQSTAGSQAVYEITGNEQYVRAEVVGDYTEPFNAPLDLTNRWGALSTDSWTVSNGILSQTADTFDEHQILLKRDIAGDLDVSVDIRLPDNGNEEQAGILFNALTHGDCYYVCLRGDSGTLANTFSLWLKSGGGWILITSPAFTPTPNTWYRLRATYDATTATIKAKVWPVGQSEPGTWQIAQTHTQIRHGAVGLRCRRKADFDNLYISGFKSYFQPVPVADWSE